MRPLKQVYIRHKKSPTICGLFSLLHYKSKVYSIHRLDWRPVW